VAYIASRDHGAAASIFNGSYEEPRYRQHPQKHYVHGVCVLQAAKSCGAAARANHESDIDRAISLRLMTLGATQAAAISIEPTTTKTFIHKKLIRGAGGFVNSFKKIEKKPVS